MFARISYFQGTAPQIDAALALIRDRLEPSLRTQSGFLGSVTLVDRRTGEGLTATYWQSGLDLGAAEAVGVAARDAIGDRSGVQLTDVDRFELLLQDRVAPPSADTFVRVTELRGAPDRVDTIRAGLLDRGIPLFKSRPGYRAVQMWVNRASGRMLVSSVWASVADLEATDADLLDEAATMRSVRVTRYEAVLASVSQAAQEAAAPPA